MKCVCKGCGFTMSRTPWRIIEENQFNYHVKGCGGRIFKELKKELSK